MTDGHFPHLRPKGGDWHASVTVRGHTYRHSAALPAAALSGLVRQLADALEDTLALADEQGVTDRIWFPNEEESTK